MKLKLTLVSFLTLLLSLTVANADNITTYVGVDDNGTITIAANGLNTNSKAALLGFDTSAAALGTVENAPFTSIGKYTAGTSLNLSSDVTLSSPDTTFYTVSNANADGDGLGADDPYGFATPGSSYYFQNAPTTDTTENFTFSFANPIDAFGAYFTGTQSQAAAETILFDDGTSESITIPSDSSNSGGIAYAGFTDPGADISSITIHEAPNGAIDHFGISNVQYVDVPPAVPEPSAAVAVVLGCALLAFYAVRKNQSNSISAASR